MNDAANCMHRQFTESQSYCPDCGLSRSEVLMAACEPYLKDEETPAECIARNRRDVDGCLTMLVAEKIKTEALQARLADPCRTYDRDGNLLTVCHSLADAEARLADEERGHTQTIKERDHAEEMADKLADAVATLLGMIRHQRDVLRECLPYINESMAGRRPGRSADDIRAAVKALTSDSASVVQYKPCEICTTQSWCETHGCQCYPVSAVQPERCCLDYPRCDCNSPPEPDDDWHCSQYPDCECFAGCREKALEAAP